MNNEWNINFLQDTAHVQKVSRLELCLPKHKWTMNKMLIFLKIRRWLKKVSTKVEINNEWNVILFQNTRHVQKLSRLKLYLPRQKWTMNEILIFFKIQDVFKKGPDWSCIYQDRTEQRMKRSFFFSKYETCSKGI